MHEKLYAVFGRLKTLLCEDLLMIQRSTSLLLLLWLDRLFKVLLLGKLRLQKLQDALQLVRVVVAHFLLIVYNLLANLNDYLITPFSLTHLFMYIK